MNYTEITVMSADGAISQIFNPVDFLHKFCVDWKTEEFLVAIKPQVATINQKSALRTYRKSSDQIRYKRYYNYDGLECWAAIREVTFKEVA